MTCRTHFEIPLYLPSVVAVRASIIGCVGRYKTRGLDRCNEELGFLDFKKSVDRRYQKSAFVKRHCPLQAASR